MATVAEWNAKTETLKGLIAEQKFKQVERQLAREKQRTDKLEGIADKVLAVEINRAEIGLQVKQSDMEGDKLALAASEEGLRQLKSVAQTLNHKLAAGPRLAFSSSSNTSNTTEG